MSVSTFTAAKKICFIGDWGVTNLKLQKILYLAHMIYLGRFKKPLIDETFEAWDYGPVLPSLYQKVKMFGSGPIEDIFYNSRLIDSGEEASVLQEAAKFLIPKTAGELVAMTHWPQGAWANTYEKGIKGSVITNEKILEEYNARIQPARQ